MTLAKVLHENCTLFNEYWATREFLNPEQPSSYLYLPAKVRRAAMRAARLAQA